MVTKDAEQPAVARERPIIFSAQMVRALLAGRKTMTRRLATSPLAKCQPGDRLWVREAWQDYCPMWEGHWCGHGTKEGIAADHRPVYRADPPESHLRGPEGKERPPGRWRPSIHMPRWASRITLEVTGVKVERLQDITPADAEAEGVFQHVAEHSIDKIFRGDRGATARLYFLGLWEKLHGLGSWDANPEVVAISFAPPTEPVNPGTAPNTESSPNTVAVAPGDAGRG